MARKNKAVDVFKYIDMQNGPIYVDPDTGKESRCWPWTGGLNNEGRPYFSLDGRKVLAYRLVYELVTGEKLGSRMFRHKCDNETCCNYAHGIPGDHQENMDDMKRRERHGLSHHMVRTIRVMLTNGIEIDKIAAMTGLSRTTITDIKNKKNYAHVKDEADD